LAAASFFAAFFGVAFFCAGVGVGTLLLGLHPLGRRGRHERSGGCGDDVLPQSLPISDSSSVWRVDHESFGGGYRGGAGSRCSRWSRSAWRGLAWEQRLAGGVHVGARAAVAGGDGEQRNRER
jgi:hypothetical protein